jgi:hypothetical protein
MGFVSIITHVGRRSDGDSAFRPLGGSRKRRHRRASSLVRAPVAFERFRETERLASAAARPEWTENLVRTQALPGTEPHEEKEQSSSSSSRKRSRLYRGNIKPTPSKLRASSRCP